MIDRRAVLTLLLTLTTASAHAEDSFATFVKALWPDAKAKGISRATFDTAMAGVTPNAKVIAATKRQPEYGKPVGAYINDAVSPDRIKRGQAKAKQWAKTFDAAEKKFAVNRWVLLALWGMETDYGAARDKWDVFRSLASLAYIKYRDPYFRNELIVAMGIMQTGHFARKEMVSSWAGAMGQSQFMPSNVIDYAIDFSGDGRADLWNNVPDVIGSTANYLHQWHWRSDLPWGFEVLLPPGFDLMTSRGTFAQWRQRGLKRADSKPLSGPGQDDLQGVLFFPAGAKGPAFVATDNFAVLKEYNNSDAYAIAVGHLADRIHGGAPFKMAWPTDDHPLSRDARIALQKKLSSLGYKVNDFEGHIDFDLRDSIRAEQAKLGLKPDGNPTPVLLTKLGVKPPQ